MRGLEVHPRLSSCSLKAVARRQDGKQGWTLHVAPGAHNLMHLRNHQNEASQPSIVVYCVTRVTPEPTPSISS